MTTQPENQPQPAGATESRGLLGVFFGPGSVQDWRRAGITLLVGSGLVFMARLLWPWTPFAIRSDVDSHAMKISRVEKVVERIASVVELHATIASSDPLSDEYRQAVVDLKRLRRVRIIDDK